MKYGFCNLAIVPVRADMQERAEQVTQLLFGDAFTILDHNKDRYFIQNFEDGYKGWIDSKQVIEITEDEYYSYIQTQKSFVKDSIAYIFQTNQKTQEKIIYPIYMGSQIVNLKFQLGGILFEISENSISKTLITNKIRLMSIAIKYLSTPYLWGGKSLFGIDCSGFTQMCYKQIGINLLRDASEQITQGEEIENISLAESSNLCFFSNKEGKIIHVGIYMGEGKIIHSSGQVRIDQIDEEGILNSTTQTYTHHLHKIKRFL
ncbi:MAG: hydrolase Nlp/P60 [Bacteroidetes bacterium]|nr:hydrolase Nlp/P60 [Bacteroidota bacterium]